VLYRLKQIDYDGSFDYSQQVAVEVNLIPNEISISQNYPNPFNPSTTIEYSLQNESGVKILIYNSIGEVIENLVSETRNAGTHRAVWNADKFPSGVYFYSFEVTEINGNKSYREMKKIVFLK
jgi:flagellar hook assembly protein FlgD